MEDGKADLISSARRPKTGRFARNTGTRGRSRKEPTQVEYRCRGVAADLKNWWWLLPLASCRLCVFVPCLVRSTPEPSCQTREINKNQGARCALASGPRSHTQRVLWAEKKG